MSTINLKQNEINITNLRIAELERILQKFPNNMLEEILEKIKIDLTKLSDALSKAIEETELFKLSRNIKETLDYLSINYRDTTEKIAGIIKDKKLIDDVDTEYSELTNSKPALPNDFWNFINEIQDSQESQAGGRKSRKSYKKQTKKTRKHRKSGKSGKSKKSHRK
jgi:hypothetical protein